MTSASAPRETVTILDRRTGKSAELPIRSGSIGPSAVDVSQLHAKTGLFFYDPGFLNTAAYESAITFVEEKGVLEYRGYDITWLMNHCDYIDVCYLLLYGELPLRGQRQAFVTQLTESCQVEENLRGLLEGFRHDADPMAIMVGAVGGLSAFYDLKFDTPAKREMLAINILAKIPVVAAWAFRYSRGLPFVYPRPDLNYTENFLHVFFSSPGEPYEPDPVLAKALDVIFMMYADHEQTPSTTTVRNAGSSQANPFAAVAAGIASLWGVAERANEAVVSLLEQLGTKDNIPHILARAKDPKDPFRLPGFGHWVYKTYDPRAIILRNLCHQVLTHTKKYAHLMELALELEQAALRDDYFISHHLYPNADFYSGLLFRAIGFPSSMCGVLFSVARAVGWIANWKEMMDDPKRRIVRPRQLYVGRADRQLPAKL